MKKKEYKRIIADLGLELTACLQVATEKTQRIAELEKENSKLKKQLQTMMDKARESAPISKEPELPKGTLKNIVLPEINKNAFYSYGAQ